MNDQPYTLTTLSPQHVVFMGGGNMTRAIVGGLLLAPTPESSPKMHISVVQRSDPNKANLIADFGHLGLRVVSSVAELAQAATVVVWSVKPQVLKEVALANKALFARHCLHISVAAGITTEALGAWLGNTNVVRCMPNTPATVGMGAAGLYAPSHITAAQRALATRVLQATGLLVWVDQEHLLEAVTAVSGSGPAYFFYFMQAMTQAGQAMGLPAHTAQALAVATARGAAELASQSTESPQQLRQRVTSKGGATFEAIAVFEQAQLAATVEKAMYACAARAKAMGDEFGGR